MRKFLIPLIFLIGLAFGLLHLGVYANAWLDDSFITFRYSEHLAQGYGPVWNPGEIPVDGYSNFSWMLLNSLALRIGIHPLLASKIMGCLSTLLIFLLPVTGCLGLLESTKSRVFMLILLVICPALAYYAQGGLETNLFTLLTFLAVIFYARFLKFGGNRNCYASAALAGVASLTRPEGLGVFGLLFLFELARTIRLDKSAKPLAPALFLFAIFWMPYFIWHLWYYGFPFPNTYYAKHTGGGLEQLLTGLIYVSKAATFYLGPPLLFSVMALALQKQKEEPNTTQKPTELFEPDIFCFFLICGYTSYIIIVGGDAAFPSFRLFVPILPVIYLLVGLCLDKLLRTQKNTLVHLQMAFLLALILSSNLVETYALVRNTIYDRRSPASGYYESLFLPDQKLFCPPELAKWVHQQLPKGGLVAMAATGITPYYTKVNFIDMLGLNDRHIAHTKKRQRGIDVKTDARYVLSRKPDLIIINVHKDVGLGKMSFAAGGGVLIGDKELLELLSHNKNYRLAVDCPATCFQKIIPSR